VDFFIKDVDEQPLVMIDGLFSARKCAWNSIFVLGL
jgi:hypothetical protein